MNWNTLFSFDQFSQRVRRRLVAILGKSGQDKKHEHKQADEQAFTYVNLWFTCVNLRFHGIKGKVDECVKHET
jgi:hypothetical protein